MDFSWIWWFFHGFFVDLVVFSWIFRGSGGFFVDFCRILVFSWIFRRSGGFCRGFSAEIDEKSKNEILKLKELPNERLEGSWGALWLGIRTFFGFKLGVVGLQGEGKLMKSQKTKS